MAGLKNPIGDPRISSATLSGSLLIEYLEYSVANRCLNHGTCQLLVVCVPYCKFADQVMNVINCFGSRL